MTIDRLVFRLVGGLILLTVFLAVVHSIHWLWVTAFIGANLLQASFTGFCPSAKIFKALGVKPGRAFE
jgi:hypothetical protein